MNRLTAALGIVLLVAPCRMLAADQALAQDARLALKAKELERQLQELESQIGNWKLKAEQWKTTLNLKKSSFSTQEEVILEITQTNTSKERAQLFDDQLFDYSIVVTDATGKPVKTTPEGDRLFRVWKPISSPHLFDVLPGESDKQKVDLAKLFSLSIPGRYQVTVGRYENIKRSPPVNVTSTGFTIE